MSSYAQFGPTTNGARPVDNTVIAVAQLAIAFGEPDANR